MAILDCVVFGEYKHPSHPNVISPRDIISLQVARLHHLQVPFIPKLQARKSEESRSNASLIPRHSAEARKSTEYQFQGSLSPRLHLTPTLKARQPLAAKHLRKYTPQHIDIRSLEPSEKRSQARPSPFPLASLATANALDLPFTQFPSNPSRGPARPVIAVFPPSRELRIGHSSAGVLLLL